MPKSAFEPCIRTRGTKVPDRPEWLIVQRDGMRVRLFTRNGHDWSDRFPLISEAALRNRTSSSFVIDGEAVLRALKAGAPDGRGPGDGGDLDFRKGGEGLAALAVNLFRAKRADRIKLIFWDGGRGDAGNQATGSRVTL